MFKKRKAKTTIKVHVCVDSSQVGFSLFLHAIKPSSCALAQSKC